MVYIKGNATWRAFCPFWGYRLSRSPIKQPSQPLCYKSHQLNSWCLKCANFVSRHGQFFPRPVFHLHRKHPAEMSCRQLLLVLFPITPISQSLMNHTHLGSGNGVTSSVITPITGVRSLRIPPWVFVACEQMCADAKKLLISQKCEAFQMSAVMVVVQVIFLKG